MKEIEIKDWQDFEAKLQLLYNERANLKRESLLGLSQFLFRGQPNLELKTTLDRYIERDISLPEYYRIILVAKAQIETFAGRTWEIPLLEEYENRSNNLDFLSLYKLISDQYIYSYMAYLRHHGFPSPLLDWTYSPYVAAFFAFNFDGAIDDPVAVYAYLEYAGSGKNTSSDKPWICTLGPNVRTHKRHFLQQSDYSACIRIKDNTAYYASHEKAFANSGDDQDIRWKFIIPAKEKMEFLKKLELMNINAYSLYGSEESLMRTLALRGFFKTNPSVW